jgi:hypothetical protein
MRGQSLILRENQAMKKLLLILIVSFISFSLMAGNLEFNQVKLVTAQETVPAGKVWKVVSVVYNIAETQTGYSTSTSTTSCNSSAYRSLSITVDGTTTKVGQGTNTAAYSNLAYVHSYTMLPLWLPAGSTLDGGPCLNKVSVIEFNVVP